MHVQSHSCNNKVVRAWGKWNKLTENTYSALKFNDPGHFCAMIRADELNLEIWDMSLSFPLLLSSIILDNFIDSSEDYSKSTLVWSSDGSHLMISIARENASKKFDWNSPSSISVLVNVITASVLKSFTLPFIVSSATFLPCSNDTVIIGSADVGRFVMLNYSLDLISPITNSLFIIPGFSPISASVDGNDISKMWKRIHVHKIGLPVEPASAVKAVSFANFRKTFPPGQRLDIGAIFCVRNDEAGCPVSVHVLSALADDCLCSSDLSRIFHSTVSTIEFKYLRTHINQDDQSRADSKNSNNFLVSSLILLSSSENVCVLSAYDLTFLWNFRNDAVLYDSVPATNSDHFSFTNFFLRGAGFCSRCGADGSLTIAVASSIHHDDPYSGSDFISPTNTVRAQSKLSMNALDRVQFFDIFLRDARVNIGDIGVSVGLSTREGCHQDLQIPCNSQDFVVNPVQAQLIVLDSCSQVRTLSQVLKSDFAGSMYPPGFKLLQVE